MEIDLNWIILAITFIVAYKKITVVNYYVKLFGFYYLFQIVGSFIATPMGFVMPRNVKCLLISSYLLKHSSTFMGLKFKIEGLEHLKPDKTLVIVANHQSSMDILGMYELWPTIRKLTAIAKYEILFVANFGISAWLAGLTFIRRKSKGAADAMNNAVDDMKKKNIKLWVFPEGTRHNTGEIHDFKKGAFHAAIHAQVPIVPVVFSTYKHILDSENKILREGEITISILPEISTEGMKREDVDTLKDKTREIMIRKYKEISNL